MAVFQSAAFVDLIMCLYDACSVCFLGVPVTVVAVSVLSDLCAVEESYEGEVSTIARQGSGSSCRSLYGGFVRWQMGTAEDGSDSKAVQVAPQAHWPDLRALILVVSDKKKETGSTVGMMTSVKTSTLLAVREHIVVCTFVLCLCSSHGGYAGRSIVPLRSWSLGWLPSKRHIWSATSRRSAASLCRCEELK